MDHKNIGKTMISLILLLFVLQLLRMGIEQCIFIFIQRTYFTDDIATMIAMLVLTIGFTILASARKTHLSVFPQAFGVYYIIATLLLVSLLLSTLIITSNHMIQTIFLVIYSSVVTPIFEEIIFRGYIWNKLNSIFEKERTTYIIVTLLFSVWHLGYIEGIAFRTPENLVITMLWKMAVGLCYGILLGVVRLKTKNCYSTILLHGIMNIFGR